MLAGEGGVDEVIEAHGWKVAGEDELVAAVDAAIAGMADTAQKVRDGNLGAVGPLVGAVMKSTGGAADAKRARELLLERLSPANPARFDGDTPMRTACRRQIAGRTGAAGPAAVQPMGAGRRRFCCSSS